LTIYGKHGATQSCELNANAAPKLFQDLVCSCSHCLCRRSQAFCPRIRLHPRVLDQQKGCCHRFDLGRKTTLSRLREGSLVPQEGCCYGIRSCS
jgi:hypothetical protein